jgi:hypothetical protein
MHRLEPMQLPRVTSDVKVRHKRLLCVKDFLVMLLEVEAHNLPAQNKLLRVQPAPVRAPHPHQFVAGSTPDKKC